MTGQELTPVEQGRLAELEEIVVVGLQRFFELGQALLEIRDSGLYRGTHPTFEAYLDERFGISRRQGYRLIDAARVIEVVCPTGHIPTTERQARELVPLLDEPEELTQAWEEAMQVSDGKPTAAVVAEKVKRRLIGDDDRVRIIALHAEGKTQKQIAKTIGCSQAAVSKIVRAEVGGKVPMPKRRQAATPQTQVIAKLHTAWREWEKLDGEEQYIPAPELARRIRVLDQALTFLTRKRAYYYSRTGKAD